MFGGAVNSWAIRYLAVLGVLVALDAVWLGLVGGAVFHAVLGSILLESPRWGAAALFYLFYALGVVVFAVQPALRAASWRVALGCGALLGFLAYMTYELTNLATVKVWTNELAAIDIAWGTLLTALAAMAGFGIKSSVARR
jgi:uncharacterized membrane protein